ncbi:MAG: GDSL-type esterase/lipase family protein [Lachnospiraceae bacterium]
MKKRRIISLVMALILSMGTILSMLGTAQADENGYDKIVGWEFGGSDSYSNAWGRGGYTATNVQPVISITDGKLKVVEDYTPATSTTYNRAMVQYNFGETTQMNLGEADLLTFDFYCETGSEPSQFMVCFSGKLQGATSATTVTENGSFSKLAKKVTSDLSGYDKYEVSVTLTAGDSNKNITQREHTARMQIGEIRTNNTFQGTIYYDNIMFWKEADIVSSVSLDSNLAVYNEKITATAENISGTLSYQWYTGSDYAMSDANEVSGATETEFIPSIEMIGGWVHCVVTNGTDIYTSKAVRIAAANVNKQTDIPYTTESVADNGQFFLTNTKAYGGKFDASKLVSNGYFLIEYTGNVTGVPNFQWATWSSTTGKSTKLISATETGTYSNGTKWAKYSYEACIAAWGDEDFSELKAIRLYYNETDKDELKVSSVSWNGAPLSYGELGESVELKGSYTSHQYLFTRHVGGTFDATRIREDSFFFVEYKGDDGAVNMVLQSHSNKESTYVTISPSETGKTGSGRYAIFSAQYIKDSFGTEFRYIDGIRLITAAGKEVTANSDLYFFEGTGNLIDDISADGYTDAINVPWTKYDDTDKDGIAVIGASITQNPLVTPLALSGAPYYAPNGGWNAILDRTDVVTYGIGSQTTVNVAERFDEVLRYNYHTIIIQCGNNDLGISSDESVVINQEVSSYTTMFEKVKEKNIALAAEGKDPVQVYVIALNPTFSEGYKDENDNCTMQTRIQHVIAAIEELSNNYDFVTYINLYDDFCNKDENGDYITGSPNNPDCNQVHVNPDLVMSDGLHPVAEGYAIYAKYLKPLLASDDESDSALVSLSYRLCTEEMKKVVPGFQTLKHTDDDKYQVLLPVDITMNANVQLYVTASNLNSMVLVNGEKPMVDAYGNEYADISLWKGMGSAEVEVTAPDGTVSVYTVNFSIDEDATVFESDEEKVITLNEGNVDLWPYIQYIVNFSGTLYTGSVLEFDVTADNTDFTGIYIQGDFDWAMVKGLTIEKDDFVNNKYHVVLEYTGENLSSVSAIQVKTGSSYITDYCGNLTISGLKLTNNIPRMEYTLSTKEDGKWKLESETGLEFVSNGLDVNLAGVEIDGIILSDKDFSIVDGLITIKPAYLNLLDPETHNICVVYVDGYAETVFTVLDKDNKVPDDTEEVKTDDEKQEGDNNTDKEDVNGNLDEQPPTGDDFPHMIYVVMLLAAAAMASLTYIKRKEKC